MARGTLAQITYANSINTPTRLTVFPTLTHDSRVTTVPDFRFNPCTFTCALHTCTSTPHPARSEPPPPTPRALLCGNFPPPTWSREELAGLGRPGTGFLGFLARRRRARNTNACLQVHGFIHGGCCRCQRPPTLTRIFSHVHTFACSLASRMLERLR
jgi:hypothetical protein